MLFYEPILFNWVPTGTTLNIVKFLVCLYQVAGVDPCAGSVVPSVKVEYQARLGPEVCSPPHLAREWMAALLRPSSNTLRLR